MANAMRAFFMHIVPSLLFLLVTPSLAAARDAVLAELFARKNIEGTLVLSSLQSEQTFVHNDERSNRRFAVASTFKILHSLIALEEKVATGKDHVIDGTARGMSSPTGTVTRRWRARSGFHASGTIRSLPAGQERRSTRLAEAFRLREAARAVRNNDILARRFAGNQRI